MSDKTQNILDLNYKMLKIGKDKCINNNIINPNIILENLKVYTST